jgi:hypothetical protein
MVLYKYYPADRVPVLTTKRIYFTRPRVLNDPFESDVEHIDRTPADVDLAAVPWFARLLEEARSRDASRALSLAVESLVVLSLSSRPDSLLMWSHYADWHAGFVIGIDVDHEEVASGRFRHLAQVRYLHDRPDRRLERQMAQDELMLTKSVEWHYEAEWRMLDSSFAALGEPLGESPDSWPFALPAAAVSEVIVGCRAGPPLLGALDRALAAPDYAHVRRFRTETDRRKFRLNVLPA